MVLRNRRKDVDKVTVGFISTAKLGIGIWTMDHILGSL